MRIFDTPLPFPSTSADGPMARLSVPEQVWAGLALTMGFAASEVTSSESQRTSIPNVVEQTSAGASVVPVERQGAAIAELRRLSGLTWDQLAKLFDVSRRALHFWASGKAMTSANQEHLQRVLGFVRQIDRGSASANRAALVTVDKDGVLPLDLLRRAEYERAARMLGRGRARRVAVPKISNAAMAARAPRPPAELAGALEDRVPRPSGRLLAAKPVGARRK